MQIVDCMENYSEIIKDTVTTKNKIKGNKTNPQQFKV